MTKRYTLNMKRYKTMRSRLGGIQQSLCTVLESGPKTFGELERNTSIHLSKNELERMLVDLKGKGVVTLSNKK